MADDTTSPSPASASLLVGREREQAVLHAALDAALAGRGSLVLIGGEAGIGKTALARDLAREARMRGAVVVVGRAFDLSEPPPYGMWLDLLGAGAAREHAEALADARLALQPGVGQAGGSQVAIFERTFAGLAQQARGRPLVCILDDLHWADPASLDLLRFVARQLSPLPLLLVGTYRADELADEHPLAKMLPALVREAEPIRLAIPPLAEGAIRQLVRAAYALAAEDEARLVAYLRERTSGNPLYLGEMLRTLVEENLLCLGIEDTWVLADLAGLRVPQLLRQVIAERVDRLGGDATRWLAVAAVIGQDVPLALWSVVAEVPEDALLELVERATAARVLDTSPDGQRVQFHHPLFRQSLYDGLSPLRRRGVHRQVGDVLVTMSHPDPDAVAYHLCQANDPRAVAWLIAAGERAQRAYAWLVAAARYENALALIGASGGEPARRGWLAFRLASLRRFADGRRALGDAEEAVRLAGEAGDPLLAAMATFLAGMLRGGYLGEPTRGIPRMEAGLRALATLPEARRVPPGATVPLDPALRWGTVVAHLAWAGRHAEALVLAERYLAEVAPPEARPGREVYPCSVTRLAHRSGGGHPGWASRAHTRAARRALSPPRPHQGSVAPIPGAADRD